MRLALFPTCHVKKWLVFVRNPRLARRVSGWLTPCMRIVVLDGYTLNPGDLSWEGLARFGEYEVFQRSFPDEVVPRARNADVLLTNKVPITASHLDGLPKLKLIGVTATGFNIVDAQAARRRGVDVTNVPAYGTESVAQMTWALILELASQAGFHAEAVRDGEWGRCPDFCFWRRPLVELSGKRLGIIGYGRIGAAVARIGIGFGMKVSALAGSRAPADSVERLPFEDLMSSSDVVSLHCPLTESTRGLINGAALIRMKRTAFLVNTSRGPLVVEQDLADALKSGGIAGAAVDVLSTEPPEHGNPLIGAPNCIVTPHIAWAALEARRRLLEIQLENLRAWVDGSPINLVN